MADPSSRNNSLRVPRMRVPSSRNASVRRISAVHAFDDHAYRQPSGAFHSLRSVDSRYSLNEQFAATRQEYEFGDDDASSVFERMTVASEHTNAGPLFDDIPEAEEATEPALLEADGALGPDCYEILCLPRAADLSPEQVRQAYYRLFLLLYPDSHPKPLQPFARRQFQRVQQAFETLVDPGRRAAYDAALSAGEAAADVGAPYEDVHTDALRYSLGGPTTPELNISPSTAMWETAPIMTNARPVLGFTLGHTVQVGLPALQRFMQQALPIYPGTAGGAVTDKSTPDNGLRLGVPALFVTTAIHGVSTDLFPKPLILRTDRSPSGHAEKIWKNLDDAQPAEPQRQDLSTTASEIVPAGLVTAQFSQPVLFPGASHPTIFDATIQSPALGAGSPLPLPTASFGISQMLPQGTVYIRGDTGNWPSASQEQGRLAAARTFLQRASLSGTVPAVEVGFHTDTVWASQLSSKTITSNVLTAQEGILGPASWTVSATASTAATAGYLRYSQDFNLTRSPRPAHQRPARVEVELCANNFWGSHLALRNLLSVGRFSTAGLEVGVGSRSIRLSLHWSRLNQRISLPVLVCPNALTTPSLVFWAGVLPLVGVSALQLLQHQWRRWRSKPAPTVAPPPPPPSQHLLQASVAARRTEADIFLTLLAGPIDARQKRLSALGHLVVLSAKYGVRDDEGSWAAEEVADVTTALAALVDRDGRILIPAGIRKGNVPGFWDPAPDREKTLLVRYAWGGRESVVEVKGDEELQLPLPQDYGVAT